MSRPRVLALVVVVAGLLAGIAHPVDLALGGVLTGGGFVLAEVLRRRSAEVERTVLVADWLHAKAHEDESVADVLARFESLTLADIAEQRRAYLVAQGRDHERRAEHERRSEAARRGAQRRSSRP